LGKFGLLKIPTRCTSKPPTKYDKPTLAKGEEHHQKKTTEEEKKATPERD